MFTRFALIFTSLFAVIGAVAPTNGDNDCQTVCCKSAADVSHPVSVVEPS